MTYEKCLNCQLVFCINLCRSENKLEGGELFVLNESIKQKKIAPCYVILPLECCCELLRAAYIGFYNENGLYDPLIELLWQCFFDLRTSAFLVITSHYRGAIQLLRPVLEIIAVGLYFKERIEKASLDYSYWLFSIPIPNGFVTTDSVGLIGIVDFIEDLDDPQKVYYDFKAWTEDKFRIEPDEYKIVTGRDIEKPRRLDFGYSIAWRNKRKRLVGGYTKRLEEKQQKFNQYLHSYYEKMNIGDPEGCSSCPAMTHFNDLLNITLSF